MTSVMYLQELKTKNTQVDKNMWLGTKHVSQIWLYFLYNAWVTQYVTQYIQIYPTILENISRLNIEDW